MGPIRALHEIMGINERNENDEVNDKRLCQFLLLSFSSFFRLSFTLAL